MCAWACHAMPVCPYLMDWVVVHQLVINCMRDHEIRQRVLSINTSGDLTTLAKLVDYIAAEEAGALKSSDLHTGHAVVRAVRKRSKFQKNKSKCACCGSPKHKQPNSDSYRQKMCKVCGKVCEKCKKTNLFSSQCRSLPSQTPWWPLWKPPQLRRWVVSLSPGQSSNSRSGTCSPPCSPPPQRTLFL